MYTIYIYIYIYTRGDHTVKARGAAYAFQIASVRISHRADSVRPL